MNLNNLYTTSRWKLYAALALFVVMVAVIRTALATPNTYESRTVLVPEDQSYSLDESASLIVAGISSSSIKVADIFHIFLHVREFASEFIEKNNLTEKLTTPDTSSYDFAFGYRGVYDMLHSSVIKQKQSRKELLNIAHQKLKSMINIDKNRQTGILTITTKDPNPKLAKEVLELFVKAISEYLKQKDLKQINDKIAYYQTILKETKDVSLYTNLATQISQLQKEKTILSAGIYYKFKMLTEPSLPHYEDRVKPEPSAIVVGSIVVFVLLVVGVFVFGDHLVTISKSGIEKLIIKTSLIFTPTSFIPLSPISSPMGLLFLIVKIVTRPKFYKVEAFLLLFFLYFIISAALFYPLSFLEYGFYRYDGNFIISYLPIFALAFIRPVITKRLLLKFIIFTSFIYFLFFIFWLSTKECSFGGHCSFGGFFEARNATGGFLSIMTVLSFVLWMNKIKYYKHMFIVFLIMLISTISRGSLIGAFIAVLVYFIFIKRNILIDKFVFVILFVLSLSVAIYFYDGSIEYKNENQIVRQYIDSETTSKEANVLVRATFLFPKAIKMFTESPFIGHGVGSFNDYGSDISKSQTYSSSHAHHSYLHFLAELGLIGFSLFLIFVFYFRKFWMEYRIVDPIIADFAYFGFLAVIFASFTEHRITTPASMMIVSLLIGTFISSVRFRKYTNEKHT